MTTTNAPRAISIHDRFGRYEGEVSANTSHAPKMISTNALNAKFFPVIKGKNISFKTTRARNGVKKTPPITRLRKIRSIFIPLTIAWGAMHANTVLSQGHPVTTSAPYDLELF